MDEDSYIKLCRLCLRKPEEEPSWLTNQRIKDELYEAFSDVELEETDKLSQIICQSCMSLIKTITDFKQSIKENQAFLLNLLQKPENNVKLGQFVEVNVGSMTDPEFKNEETVDGALNPKSCEPLSDQNMAIGSDSNYEVSERDSLSDEDFAIPDKDSELKSDKLSLPPLRFEKGTKSVWCPFCYKKFKCKYFLSDHGKLRHPEYNWAFRKPKSTRSSWACKFCDKVYSRRFLLKEHALVVHFGRESYQCDLCGFKAPLKNGIRGHIEQTHMKKYSTGPSKKVCDICNHVCPTKVIYKNHMLSHQESEERPFKCVKCDLHFRMQAKLDKHNRDTHIDEDRPFACDLCISARFLNEEVLNLHKKLHEHNETKRDKQPFACSACELRFCKKSMLDTHVKRHENNEIDSCQVCGVTLHLASLRYHMGTHKTKYEEYKNVCHQCGRRFRFGWGLVKHEKSHESPEFFECYYCGKIFKKRGTFTEHVISCKGPETEFPCKFCGKRFLLRSARYNHEERAHKGWSCKRCNMRFDRSQHLKMHRRTLEHKQKRM